MTRDWKQEALDAMTARSAEEEAAWRKNNVGKVKLYLVSAPDDPPTFSTEYQTEMRQVIAALHANKVEADAPFMTMDSVDATGGYIGEIVVPLVTAFAPVFTGIMGAWVQSRFGRKFRLKDGDIEVEAPSLEGVKELHAMAVEQQAKRPPNLSS